MSSELILKLLFVMIGRFQRAKPIIIDPGLYMSKKADVFWVTQKRSVPSAFKLFTGAFPFSSSIYVLLSLQIGFGIILFCWLITC